MTGPRRRADDHVHPESWNRDDQHRFEDRVAGELRGLREDVEGLTSRVLMIFGGIAVLAFMVPILAPIVRGWLGIQGSIGP